MVMLAQQVENISPSGVIGAIPGHILPTYGAMLVSLALFKTRLRLLGFVFVPVLILSWENLPSPNILISENGRAIAVADAEGVLKLVYPGRNRFVTNIW